VQDTPAKDLAALEANTDKSLGPNACWLWTGKRENGYGVLKSGARAHRVALAATGALIGRWPVCHKCDNRACVNPAHLYVGTPKSNARDAMARGRLVLPDGRRLRSLEAIGRKQARLEAWDEAQQIEPGDLSGISSV